MLPESVIVCNDDMFCMKPQRGKMPSFHRGRLADQLARLRSDAPLSRYTAMLNNVQRALDHEGIAGAYEYETHVPMPMTKTGILKALEVRAKWPGVNLSKRTLYGNVNAVGGRVLPGPIPGQMDVKVRHADGATPTGAWLSTTEQSFAERFYATLADAFPEPSRYER